MKINNVNVNANVNNLSYLIILYDSDMIESCFNCNKKDIIMKNKKFFLGNIDIISYEKFTNNEYKNYEIDGLITPNSIYVLLNKTKKYVQYDLYNDKYRESEISELENIFINLKAESISIKEYYSNSQNNEISGGIEVNTPNINIGNNIEVNNNHKKNLTRSETKTFGIDNNDVYNDTIFKDHKEYYYLQNNEKWKKIISNRLKKKMLTDEYSYTYYEKTLFNYKLMNNLNFLNINMSYNTSTINIIHIEYSVTYHKLKKIKYVENENLNILHNKDNLDINICYSLIYNFFCNNYFNLCNEEYNSTKIIKFA